MESNSEREVLEETFPGLVEADEAPEPEPRRGGQWKGCVKIADDFDELPDEFAEAFGVHR